MELGSLNKEVIVYFLNSSSDFNGSKSDGENIIYALG